MKIAQSIPGLNDALNSSPAKNFPTNAKLADIISPAINVVLLIATFLAFTYLLIGSFQYIIARGDKHNLEKARNRIMWAIIGLVVIFGAFMASQFAAQIVSPLLKNHPGTPLSIHLVPVVYAQSASTSAVDIGQNYSFGGVGSFGEAFRALIVPIFSVAGILVVGFLLWGGFKYLISGGNKEAVSQARSTITYAIVGFILLAVSFFVFEYLSEVFGLPKII